MMGFLWLDLSIKGSVDKEVKGQAGRTPRATRALLAREIPCQRATSRTGATRALLARDSRAKLCTHPG